MQDRDWSSDVCSSDLISLCYCHISLKMMKLSALICLCCCCWWGEAAAQKKSKKPTQVSFSNELLLGRVESIEQHCYKAVEKSGKLLKGSRTAERYPPSTFIESYGNAIGNFDPSFRLLNLRFYDETGRLTRQDLHQPEIGRASCRERVLLMV